MQPSISNFFSREPVQKRAKAADVVTSQVQAATASRVAEINGELVELSGQQWSVVDAALAGRHVFFTGEGARGAPSNPLLVGIWGASSAYWFMFL
jgi:hypothetical protein